MLDRNVVWKPLTAGQIRILTVLCDGVSLSATLTNIAIEEAQYNALSYCWADDAKRAISVNGRRILISGNLYEAMSNLAVPWDPIHHLWVDAFCINQEDLQERNQQVTMMGVIFRNAKRVYIYLGGLGEQKRFCDHPVECRFLAHRWWTRAWTLQEAVLAQDLSFYDGGVTLSLDDLSTYCRSLKTRIDSSDADRLFTLMRLRAKSVGLLEAVVSGMPREATDPRDKVYAFLGLSHDLLPGLVRYDVPVESCYISFTNEYIRRSGRLDFLQHVDQACRKHTLPSWCPEWQSSSYPMPFGLNMGHADQGMMAAPSCDSKQVRARGTTCGLIASSMILLRPILPNWAQCLATMLNGGLHNQRALLGALKTLSRFSYPNTAGTYMDASLAILSAVIKNGQRRTASRGPIHLATTHQQRSAPSSSAANVAVEAAILMRLWAGNTAHFLDFISRHRSLRVLKEHYTQATDRHVADVYRRVSMTEGSTIFCVENGYIGLATGKLEVGDTVTILSGCSMPCILRQSSDEPSNWEFVCCAYIHGLMNGEAVEMVRNKMLMEQEFKII